MPQPAQPTDPSAPTPPAASPQNNLPGSQSKDPVEAAEAHLADVDMDAQRDVLKRLTK